VSAARQKKGIFGHHGAKAGQIIAGGRVDAALETMRRVSAEPIDVMSLTACSSAAAIPGSGAVVAGSPGDVDHDFVIDVSRRNKLKD
jgi:hypothetical protein